MTNQTDASIGNTLRNRRLELGISFEEVVNQTRIRQSYLEALEQERFDTFPGDAYLKGYLKGYAECLGLDPHPLLDALPGKKPALPDSHLIESASLSPVEQAPHRSPIPLRGALLLVGLLILLGLGWLWFGRQSSAPQPEPALPAAGSETRQTPVPTAVDAPPTAAENQPAAATDQTKPAAEAPAATAAVEPGAAATQPPAAPGAESATAVAVPAAQGVDLTHSDAGVLRLQATGPGQLELTIDGRPAQRYSLQANTILSWKVGRTVSVYLDNPGSARLWLGGREVDLAGRNQIVLQLAQEPSR
jgi:cytoskeletal protein RodZ